MKDMDRLCSWFESGRLVRPTAEEPNTVDLIRSLAALAGVAGLELAPGASKISAKISRARHYVFILVDGLGMNVLRGAPADGFLFSHLARQLQAVFPSTTATALMTLATAEWPCRHGVTGWWLYLDQFNVTMTTVQFSDRLRTPAEK